MLSQLYRNWKDTNATDGLVVDALPMCYFQMQGKCTQKEKKKLMLHNTGFAHLDGQKTLTVL